MSRISEQGWNQIMANISQSITQKQATERSPVDEHGHVHPEWQARLDLINEAMKQVGVEIVIQHHGQSFLYLIGEHLPLFGVPTTFLEDVESAIQICTGMIEVYHLAFECGQAKGYEQGCKNTQAAMQRAMGIHQ